MKLLTGLFRKAKRSLMTKDADMETFRDTLDDLVSNKDSLSDEEIVQKVESLKEMCDDLPDDEGKEKLVRFLEDFKAVKEQDAEVAQKAADDVSAMFESLDSKAMEDTPDVPAESEEATETGDEDGAEETEEVEETETVEEPEDNADGYTLEDIYQFVKKRMAEDVGAEDSAEEVDEEETATEEDEEEVTKDHAPHLAITMGKTQQSGSLAAMFNQIKGGK